MSVNDDSGQDRTQVRDALGDAIGAKFLRLRVDDLDGQSLEPAESRHQSRPYRVLDGGQLRPERLIDLAPARRVDEHKVEFRCSHNDLAPLNKAAAPTRSAACTGPGFARAP